tara:strand:+ start:474 stop:1277 length:804 start_codon:yes stop_codon:yes gene_type:complete
MNNSFNSKLKKACEEKNNRLCIGLDINPKVDTDNEVKIIDYIESFAKEVIDATIEFCPVYKPNLAFYEKFGYKGIKVLESIVDYIDGRAITIADAKRGDIGNTTKRYASAIFEKMGFDSITVSPYMGRDSIKPFIDNESKGAFILCLTSNKSAIDFQFLKENGRTLYQKVAEVGVELNSNNNVGLVVGATQPEYMESIIDYSKGLNWLIPGIGAQGGDLEKSLLICKRSDKIGIINVSRGILSAGNGEIDDIVSATINYTNEIRKYI